MLTISQSQFPVTALTGYRSSRRNEKRFGAQTNQPKLAESNARSFEYIEAEFEELLDDSIAGKDSSNGYTALQFPKFLFKRVHVDYYA